MTTFTLADYVANKEEKKEQIFEPIPFAGMVAIQDQEDREEMLRHQLHVVQAECRRLQEILRKNGIQY